jgi:hypothetical protein
MIFADLEGLVHTSNHWTSAGSWNSRNWKIWKNSSLSESTGSGKYIGEGIGRARQLLVLLNAEQVGEEIEQSIAWFVARISH